MYNIDQVERSCSALNSPEKCIALAVMDVREDLHVDDIRDKYNELHGKSSHAREYRSSTDMQRWIAHSLLPCGLVDENPNRQSVYSISSQGREIGIPLSGHLMSLTGKYLLPQGHDLEDIIGVNKPLKAQGPTSIRTPMRRLAFMRALITSPTLPIQQSVLEREVLALGQDYVGGFDRTLGVFSENGVIHYYSGRKEAVEEMEDQYKEGRKEFTKYRLGDVDFERIEQIQTSLRGIARDILIYLEHNPDEELRVSEVADKLIQNFERYSQCKSSTELRDRLIERVANALPVMSNHNLILKGKYTGLYQSEIDITEFGSTFFSHLIQILDMTASGDEVFLRSGREQIKSILYSRQRVLEFLSR